MIVLLICNTCICQCDGAYMMCVPKVAMRLSCTLSKINQKQ